MRWQRATRYVVALVGLTCAGALLVYTHRRARQAAPPPTAMRDPTATSEQDGVTTLRWSGNKEELQYDAAHVT